MSKNLRNAAVAIAAFIQSAELSTPAIEEADGGLTPMLTAWEIEKVRQRLMKGRYSKFSKNMTCSFMAKDRSALDGDPGGYRFIMRSHAQGMVRVGTVIWGNKDKGIVVVAIDLDKTEFVRGEFAKAAEHRAGTQTKIDETPLGPDEEVIEEPCSCAGKDPACKWCVDGKILTRRKKVVDEPFKCPNCEGTHVQNCGFGSRTCMDCQWVEGIAEDEAMAQGDAQASSPTVCMKCHGELQDGFPHEH